MGIKRKLKFWLRAKLKNLLEERTPVLISSNVLIEAGEKSYHNGNFIVRGSDSKVSIGSYCAIGKDVKVILNNHSIDYASIQYSFYKSNFNSLPFKDKRPIVSVEIGSDVWIGDNVIILPNVKVGHGCVIGAGSVVTKSVEPYSIIAGVPAKKIRMRFDSITTEELITTKWWTWSEEKIKKNKLFFYKKRNK